MSRKHESHHPGSEIHRESVRQVFRSWRTIEQLGTHPLAALHIVQSTRQLNNYPDTPLGRGKALQDVLLEVMEKLKPDATTPNPTIPSWRAYLFLTGYYIQGKRKLDLMDELGHGASTMIMGGMNKHSMTRRKHYLPKDLPCMKH